MTILNTKIVPSTLALGVVLLAAGCSKPPTDAVNAAKAALETAREAGAADYALESLGAAERAQTDLEVEIAAQEQKFSLLRSYAKAEELATAAQAAAAEATQDAAAGKEAARTEATTLMDSVRATLAEVKELVDKAPRGKGTRAEIDAMKADVAAVESGVGDIDAAILEGQYLDALAKAQAASETLDQVKAEIQGAMDAKEAARR